MNAIEKRLNDQNATLYGKFYETKAAVELLLQRYSDNFPEYTDHSINHTFQVLNLASLLLTVEEINNLNSDELYILCMSCILHDIGMCIPKETIGEFIVKSKYSKYFENRNNTIDTELIRDLHHEFSYDFILRERELLMIPDERYAEAIALVAKGHRKVALDDVTIYNPKYFVRSGREFVCLPYLACILRIADELDVTNIRTPKLLTKYYMPNKEKSIKEWNKHISTTQINFTEDKVIYIVNCSDHNILGALEEQFDKIQNVINYGQKVIRTISNTELRRFKLKLISVESKFNFINFNPKGIKFTFDVQNVVRTFIGEDLYDDKLAALREAIQNSIDSCLYKRVLLNESYTPCIHITLDEKFIIIKDNGLGMDEFIVENYFGKLGSSFYDNEAIKNQYESIGQFGVGVFAYFLLSDYIDIITKTENGNPLMFRIDNDPKNYFHFYDDFEVLESGTTITLYLKDDIQMSYKCEDYVKYIQEVFRYVEMPIFIKAYDKKYEIAKQSFSIDILKLIKHQLKREYSHKYANFDYINVYINNEDFEGELFLIINKFGKKPCFEKIDKYFEYDSNEGGFILDEYSIIKIYQKGVYINEEQFTHLGYVIGNINLKRRLRLNISRSDFSDAEEVNDIFDLFAISLIKKLFTMLKEKYFESIIQLTDSFIGNYWQNYSYFDWLNFNNNNNYNELFGDFFYLECFIKQKTVIITFAELIKQAHEFIMITNKEDKIEVYNYFKVPVVVANIDNEIHSYFFKKNLFTNIFKFIPSISYLNNKGYQKFSYGDKYELENVVNRVKDLFTLDTITRRYNFQNSDSKYLNVDTFKNKENVFGKRYKFDDDDVILNLSHPFVKFIFKNEIKIRENKEYTRSLYKLLDKVIDISIASKVPKNAMKSVNSFLATFDELEILPPFVLEDYNMIK